MEETADTIQKIKITKIPGKRITCTIASPSNDHTGQPAVTTIWTEYVEGDIGEFHKNLMKTLKTKTEVTVDPLVI